MQTMINCWKNFENKNPKLAKWVREGGLFIAMKGAAGREEMQEAANGCIRLGGTAQTVTEHPLHTCEESEARTVLAVQKTAATPAEFPRAFGNIKKKPL